MAVAYARDTVVVDIEEPMHVKIAEDPEVWHRTADGAPETACGITIDYRLLLGQRAGRYQGRLCTTCFTPHERARAARNKENDHG